jgi:hypothetical protein
LQLIRKHEKVHIPGLFSNKDGHLVSCFAT